jgi:hypothetical protein
MSEASSRASVDSTSDSSELATPSLGSARPMSGAEASSPPTGPESSAARTFETWAVDRNPDGKAYMHRDRTPTLDKGGTGFGPLIFSAEASPAKTSASQDDEPDSQANAQDSSTSSQGSLTLFSPLGGGSSLRTYPDYFPPNADEISLSYSRRWPTSGFTTSPGECWTADTSESPNAGAVSTSLRDVLEEAVPARYFLSPRAAAGILRRAEKRGRELPQHLADALRLVSTTREAAS